MRILVVEDDPSIGFILKTLLSHQNYAVELATDGMAAWEMANAFEYDMILLDVMLPKLDGITLCQRLRAQGQHMPILLLTGHADSHDKAVGLDAGADDYVVKPFDPEELTARVRALLRRGELSGSPVLTWRGIQLDPQVCEVTYQGHLLPLTPKEYALLELLMRHHHRVFSCGMILDHLWSHGEAPGEEAVRTHIKGLRHKLKAAHAAPDLIETVYGIGYRLKAVTEPPLIAAEDQPQHLPSTMPERQQTRSAIAGLWDKCLPRLRAQLQQLETAALALAQDATEIHLRAEAAEAAQALSSNLSTLSLSTGAQVAHRLAAQCQGQQPLTREQIVAIHQDVEVLHQVIRQRGVSAAPNANPPPPAPLTPAGESSDSPVTLIEAQILVVDDSADLLTLLTTLLEPWGLRVHSLSDPRHVLTRLEQINPDLLILDIKMPHINGVELCQQLRQASRWRSLPILFLTGHAGSEIIDRVFAAGADDFVSKPIVGPELVIRILNRLERVRTRQGAALLSQS